MQKEIEHKIGGESFRLLPDFRALEIAEQKVGSLYEAFIRLSERKARLSDIVAVLYGCVDSANPSRRYLYDEIGRLVLKDGMLEHYPIVLTILSGLITGEPSEEDAKAEEIQKKTE